MISNIPQFHQDWDGAGGRIQAVVPSQLQLRREVRCQKSPLSKVVATKNGQEKLHRAEQHTLDRTCCGQHHLCRVRPHANSRRLTPVTPFTQVRVVHLGWSTCHAISGRGGWAVNEGIFASILTDFPLPSS